MRQDVICWHRQSDAIFDSGCILFRPSDLGSVARGNLERHDREELDITRYDVIGHEIARCSRISKGSNGSDGRDKVIGSSQGPGFVGYLHTLPGRKFVCHEMIVLLASAVKFVGAHG